jgi:ribokinase
VILVFGSINVDLIFALDRLPQEGETVLGPGVLIQPGGKGANQAVAAARDGASVVMVGAVGRDSLTDAALGLMRDAGVDLRRVDVVEQATGCAAICTDREGRNLIAVGSGANLRVRADQVEDALLGSGTTLVLQREVDPIETETLIRTAHAAGSRIVLNLAPAGPLDPAVLRLVDVLVANEREAAWLAQFLGVDEGAMQVALGTTVVRTLGARGAAYAGPGGDGVAPALAVTVVDTTAAGDCFTGVLAAALDRGLALAEALARASVAAGLCCTRRGSQSSLPLRSEIDGALRSR